MVLHICSMGGEFDNSDGKPLVACGGTAIHADCGSGYRPLGALAISKFLKKPQAKTTWLQNVAVIETTWNTFLIWFVLLGVYLAIEISIIPQTVKKPTLESLASLFVISLMWAANRLSSRIIRFYVGKTEAMKSLTSIALNISRIIIIVIGLLILFDVWGVPTFPIILVLVAGLFIIVFVFKNTLDNLLAGF